MNKDLLFKAGVIFSVLFLILWVMAPRKPVVVVLPEGVSAAQAAGLLKGKGVIVSRFVFRLAAKATGVDRRIKAGTYQLRQHMWLFSLLKILNAGASNKGIQVIIPEGFSARQIGERLEASGICSAADFENYVAENNLEGYLFPSVYYFEPRMTPKKAAQKMEDEFFRVIGAEYQKTSPKPILSFRKALILASIIQREAVLSREKPLIASVYLNRLRLRMKLEADPTVQYALGRWKKRLAIADLKTDSPYNTYLYYGLPPGPICSPGLDSFIAALHPAETDDLYFVADDKGGHRFATTNAEHIKNKELLKKALREKKEKLSP